MGLLASVCVACSPVTPALVAPENIEVDEGAVGCLADHGRGWTGPSDEASSECQARDPTWRCLPENWLTEAAAECVAAIDSVYGTGAHDDEHRGVLLGVEGGCPDPNGWESMSCGASIDAISGAILERW
jgi:hypothetical protein